MPFHELSHLSLTHSCELENQLRFTDETEQGLKLGRCDTSPPCDLVSALHSSACLSSVDGEGLDWSPRPPPSPAAESYQQEPSSGLARVGPPFHGAAGCSE